MKRALLAILLLAAACREGGDTGPGATDRPLPDVAAAAVPPGSIPRDTVSTPTELAAVAPPVTPTVLALGRDAWIGKCAPCHGVDGEGLGPVVRKGFPRPPPIRSSGLSAAEIVAVVTVGKGQMPALAAEVPPAERWAVAYWLQAGGANAR